MYIHLTKTNNKAFQPNSNMQENLLTWMSSNCANTFLKNSMREVFASYFLKIQFLDYLKVDSVIKLNAPLTTFLLRDLLPAALFSVLLLKYYSSFHLTMHNLDI